MFDLFYKPGKSFKESYFIGKDADRTRVISAMDVIPEEMQKKILAFESGIAQEVAEEKTDVANAEDIQKIAEDLKKDEANPESKEGLADIAKKAGDLVTSENAEIAEMQKNAGIKSPEEIGAAIYATVKTFDGFEKFCKEALAHSAAKMQRQAKAADPLQTTFQAETAKQESGSLDADGPVVSVNPKEAKTDLAGGSAVGGSQTSPVKSYYGRLPNKGGNTPTETINRQSSGTPKDDYMKLTKAFEEMQEKNKELEKKIETQDKEIKEKNKEIGNESKKKDVDAALKAIKDVVTFDEKTETLFVDKLTKIEDASLKLVADIVKEIGKALKAENADVDAAKLFGGGKEDEKKTKDTGFPEFGTKAATKMPGENFPQIFSNYNSENVFSGNNLFE